MKTLKIFLFCLMQLFITTVFAQSQMLEFISSRDAVRNDSTSNLSLYNNRGSAISVYGLYVRQYAYVTPGDTCDHSTVIYSTTQNKTAGAFVMPTVINAGKGAAIGSNYLYNMIYQAIYYENIIIPSSPPGCALPGCTWGSDTTKYNWCIYLGALAPVSTTAGYTANVPPSTDSASSAGVYDYNLITSYVSLGPISCDDRELTCIAANQQTQPLS